MSIGVGPGSLWLAAGVATNYGLRVSASPPEPPRGSVSSSSATWIVRTTPGVTQTFSKSPDWDEYLKAD